MSSEWQIQYEDRCPSCGQPFVHRERLNDGETEHDRSGYVRLSIWVLKCTACGRIDNKKRPY